MSLETSKSENERSFSNSGALYQSSRADVILPPFSRKEHTVLSIVNKNIISNLLGKALSVLLSIVFVPFYLKYLGAEAYGLIGVFATLQSVFMLADMGLSGTFTRETARLSVVEDGARQIGDLCRTFEGIFAVGGLLIAIVIAASSRMIAEHWVNLAQLSVTSVSNSIILIGVAVGLQFPFFIYQGGILGMQRQMCLNVLLLSLGLARGLGAVLILAFVDQSIQAFFIWQVAISAIQLIAGYFLIWRILPGIPGKPRFDLNLIRPLWRFAAGTAGITLTGILLTQSDKVILTKILPLEKFGYYSLAGVVASVPGMIAMPFNNAIYPRFTQLVAMGNIPELTALYHRSCQLLAVIVIPVGLVLACFSKQVMFLWTGSILTAQNTFLLASVLMIGSTLMCLMVIPYALQLAFAWTRLGLYLNIIAVITLVPAMVWLVSIYGALGACFVCVALYTGQVIGMIHLMHRRILQGEKWKWYIDDVGKPLVAPLLIGAIGRLFINEAMSKPVLVASLGCVLFVAICASATSAPLVRNMIFAKMCSFRSAHHSF
jgi:O-antigen/teichoic acid export membrane protein